MKHFARWRRRARCWWQGHEVEWFMWHTFDKRNTMAVTAVPGRRIRVGVCQRCGVLLIEAVPQKEE